MPLPTPRNGEEKKNFINRCMGNDTTNQDFPDVSQRRAVCEKQWDKRQSGESMKYPHVYHAITTAQWGILPAKLAEISSFIEAKALDLDAEFPKPVVHDRFREPYQNIDGVAVIPLFGTIVPRVGSLAEFSGGTSIQRFQNAFAEAMNDDSIHSVVIESDSPGGMMSGTFELADQIHEARGTKPIVAVANTLMASAAYLISSQADEVVASSSSMLGSIGVIQMHRDESAMWEQRGVKTTLVTSGKHKAAGSKFGALEGESFDYIQSLVDDSYKQFAETVARGRGLEFKEADRRYGDARIFRAHNAVENGLADSIGTLQQVIDRLAGKSQLNNTRSYTYGFSDSSINSISTSDNKTPPVKLELNISDGSGEQFWSDLVGSEPIGGIEVNDDQVQESQEEQVADSTESTGGMEGTDLQAQLEAAQREIDAKDEMIESLSGRVGSLETENRRKRFTDIVMGRAEGSDGQRWFGDLDAHVKLMETLAQNHGEDSEELQSYISINAQQAKMIHESKAFESAGHDADMPMSTNPVDEFNKKVNEARKQATETGGSLTWEDAVAQVANSEPALYQEYARFAKVRV